MARPEDWPEGWPHPEDGGPPDGWRDIEWLTFCAGIEDPDLSYIDLGHLVGRKKGTISSWVQRWRARYGPTFFARAKTMPAPRDRVLAGARAAGMASSGRWAEVRADAADGYAAGGWLALQLSGVVAAEILDDPERRAELTAGDVLKLARAGEIWTRVADRLADIPDPGRLRPGATDLDAGIPPGLTAGFERSALPSGLEGADADTMENVGIVLAAAAMNLEIRRDREREAIEVDESADGS